MLARDRELDMWIERYVFFFGDFSVTPPQRRSSTHSLSQSLSHTHTLTHTDVVKWFQIFRVLQIFLTTCGQQEFFDRQGVTQHPKIFPECYKCFQLFMFIFFRRHYAAHVSMIRFLTCHVRSHCWK